MNGLLGKATVVGASEAIAGVPDEIKQAMHTLSNNRQALAALVSVDAASYFALSNTVAAGVGTAIGSWAIPVVGGVYVGWRIYEGYRAANAYMEQNASQCDQY